MFGYVVWYRPEQRAGVVAVDGGTELTFEAEAPAVDLQGGDLVEFATRTHRGVGKAVDLRLVTRWVDYLNERYRPLVNEFHSVVTVAQ